MAKAFYLSIVEVSIENGDKSLIPVSFAHESVLPLDESEVKKIILNEMENNYKTKRVILYTTITEKQYADFHNR
ncbi:MAG: hypothetical protein K2K68_04995 [Duncaniella sp.]|nr:hypothetical protein [Duncaniella sp.]